ncbi:hypothetical protein E5676_scaffold386G00200 [Cucumis melo var. makuwa]|uniref:Uncharacterized protein n=1 Tax=Cucumis melo var. makuwa TaxID=1194695 RepID=A0A5D3DHB6_CUCMM|nr:hypothetical protein E5676_scaffold386G00200 [Cucumis melo var. makuwa]
MNADSYLGGREVFWNEEEVENYKGSTLFGYNLKPDCLSVSFGYTKDQIVLGVPLGSPKTRFVSTRSQIARVRERASSWIHLYRILMENKGKGRGKLASDREGSVTCHMGT